MIGIGSKFSSARVKKSSDKRARAATGSGTVDKIARKILSGYRVYNSRSGGLTSSSFPAVIGSHSPRICQTLAGYSQRLGGDGQAIAAHPKAS